MKKGLYNLALLSALLTTSLVYAENTEDLHSIAIQKQHFGDAQNFAQWYDGLSQEDKDLVLAGTVYECYPNLTKAALSMNGNPGTKLWIARVTSGHDQDSSDFIYAYTSGDDENFLITAIKDSLDRTSKAAKKESCGHTFSMMGSGTSGLITLFSAAVSFCEDKNKKIEMLELLKEQGLDINETNDLYVSPLSEAILQKDIELVAFLLQNGADFNKTFALSRLIDEYYSYRTDEKREAMWDYVIAYLKEHKLSLEAETDAYIQTAISGDDKVKAKLKDLNLQPDYSTMAAQKRIITVAATSARYRTNYDLLRELIDHGLDVNYQDKNGRTALFYVTKKNGPKTKDIEIVKYLLDHGADANIKDKNGKTAFDGCAYKICQLNPNGMRKFAPDDKTIEPTLYQALDDKDCATIVDLIKQGADPYTDVGGTALLFRLYDQNKRQCLEDVLNLKIDLNKVHIDKIGNANTALTYANRRSKEVVPLLEQYGATETDDTQRIQIYSEMQKKCRDYSKQTLTEIEEKLKEDDLKDWEIKAYNKLLEEQKMMKKYKEELLQEEKMLKDKIREEIKTLTYENRWSKEDVPSLKQDDSTETDDIQRINTYNEMLKKCGDYSEQTLTEIEKKLKENDLKNWEIKAYNMLLKEQKMLKEYKEHEEDDLEF